MPLLGSVAKSFFAGQRPAKKIVTPPPPPVCGPYQNQIVTGKTSGGSVWGSNPYTADSDFNVAAVHAGLISVGQTATIRKTSVGYLNSFTGSFKNGIQTSDWTTGWCGVNITLITQEPPDDITCGPFEIVTVTARADSPGTVWGSNPYTSDSDLAKAVIHASLAQDGETISVERYNPVISNALGATVNGITSLSRNEFTCCFSIRKQKPFCYPIPTYTLSSVCTSTYERMKFVPSPQTAYRFTTDGPGLAGAPPDQQDRFVVSKTNIPLIQRSDSNLTFVPPELPSSVYFDWPTILGGVSYGKLGDEGYFQIPLPFVVNFFGENYGPGTAYPHIFVSTNSFFCFYQRPNQIFGWTGDRSVSNLNNYTPESPKVFVQACDGSSYGVYYGTEYLQGPNGPTLAFRVRYTGSGNPFIEPGSGAAVVDDPIFGSSFPCRFVDATLTRVWEAVFYENAPKHFDLNIYQNDDYPQYYT